MENEIKIVTIPLSNEELKNVTAVIAFFPTITSSDILVSIINPFTEVSLT